MRRLTEAGTQLAGREELRLGLIKEKARVINVLKKYSSQSEGI